MKDSEEREGEKGGRKGERKKRHDGERLYWVFAFISVI